MSRLYITEAKDAGNLSVDLLDGNIVWGKNRDLIFPVEQLHAGAIV